MKQTIILSALGGAALMLGGCVSVPNAELFGSMPSSGTFSMASQAGKASDIEGRIRARLQDRGLTNSPNGIYLVQATLAEHKSASGMAVSNDPQWLHPPGRGSGNIMQLNVTVSLARDGTEIFRATSTKPTRHVGAKTIDQLVNAVFVSITKGAPRPPEAAQG